MIVQIFIKNEKLDLFKDENISISSAITDSEDIARNIGDFSKSFTVPATNINNRIFKHYYNANIDNTFDARVKVNANITLDGLPFKTGKISLTKVNVKSGRPSSYTINFYGNLISFKDKFGKDELKDLDLSAFNHNYNGGTVMTGLTNGLFNRNIIYNLIVKKQYYYNSNSNDHGSTEFLENIASHQGHSTSQLHGVRFTDLFPAIRLIEIIKAIETKYEVSFSRDYFGRYEFQNLYLWLNRDKDSSAGGGTQIVNFDGGSQDFIDFNTNIGTYNTCLSCGNLQVYFRNSIEITPSAGYENVPYSIRVVVNDDENNRIETVGNGVLDYDLSTPDPVTHEVYYEIISNAEFKYTAKAIQRHVFSGTFVFLTKITTASQNTISSQVQITELTPKIKIIDFLKSIFSAAKLVVLPINESSVYVNSLVDFYANGRVIDVTKHIDFDSYDVERGKLLNEINFKFQEPSTILNKTFEKNTGLAYGDEELKLADEDDKPLDGTKLDVSLAFEQVVYERLNDLNGGESTNIMYAAILDEEVKATNIKPLVFYNVRQRIGAKKIAFIGNNNQVTELSQNINTASHTINFTDQMHSFIFSKEYSNWDGRVIDKNLYTRYYKDYVLSIFNIKRRNFKYDAILPLWILTSLQLNDVLKIKENFYRIDNFNLNLNDGKSKLELINSFDNDLSDMQIRDTVFYVDTQAQRVSTYVAGKSAFQSKVDTAYNWITLEQEGNILFMKIDENTSDYARYGVITVFIGSKEKNIQIIQYGLI